MLKSYWYYWYTGRRLVAVISMILTTVLVGLGMMWAVGFSVWGVVLAVLMDAVGFWVAVIYALVLREYLPQMFIDQVDGLIFYQFIIPVIAVFIIGRVVTFGVAKFFAAQAQSTWLRQAALSVIAVSALAFGAGLWGYQAQQQAAAEAARRAAEAQALSFARVKMQAGELSKHAVDEVKHLGEATASKATELTDTTTKAVSETAASVSTATGKAFDAACVAIAKTLGKKPEEHCDTPAPTDTPKP
ncbi:hypothetical protein [Thiofilum flexile]|uniref:hypothetical protein n=1 Tax=Thiofilum flexile TaxID=125627 RepID=UPI0003796977|nr:hypothetical protein [Thiofilum flexile]